MIVEALRHALIPCPKRLKRLGVLHDLIALEARAKRQRSAWAPHLDASRNAVADWAERTPRRKLAVIAGSGLFVGIPLPHLAATFERVLCLDLFHMPAAQRLARRFPNVSLIDHDVLGLLQHLPEALAAGRLPEPVASLPFAAEADLLVSANMATQLPLPAMEAAEAQGGFSPTEITAWGRSLVEAHFASLTERPGVTGLITDTDRLKQPVGSTETVDWWDLLEGAALPELMDGREWTWDIALAPEEERHFDYRHRVVAGLLST